MCLAIPAKVLSVEGTRAVCEMTGVQKDIDISLTPEVEPGQWVIVHVGFALQIIDEAKAEATLQAMATVGASTAEAETNMGAQHV